MEDKIKIEYEQVEDPDTDERIKIALSLLFEDEFSISSKT